MGGRRLSPSLLDRFINGRSSRPTDTLECLQMFVSTVAVLILRKARAVEPAKNQLAAVNEIVRKQV